MVDHIVVQQRRGVNELDRCGQIMMRGPLIAQQARARERQHRPHALAAARYQVPGQLGDQGDARLHPIQNDRVDAIHIPGDESDQGIERRRRVPAKAMRGGNSHDAGRFKTPHAKGKRNSLRSPE